MSRDWTYGLMSLSEKMRKSNHLQMLGRHSNLWCFKTGRFSPGHTLTYRDNNLFCKTGREDGPLKEDWGRELRKLTDRQPRSKNDFGFGTKLRFINPFPHASLKPTCVSITWTLIFELFQKPADFDKNPDGPGIKMHQKTGDSREKQEGWNVWLGQRQNLRNYFKTPSDGPDGSYQIRASRTIVIVTGSFPLHKSKFHCIHWLTSKSTDFEKQSCKIAHEQSAYHQYAVFAVVYVVFNLSTICP